MLISICFACHNRAFNVKEVFPSIRAAADFSPPVEIVALDYNSQDDFREYIEQEMETPLTGGGRITYRKYTGRDYYHMAHARNLAILASSGEYCVMSDCDTTYEITFFKVMREMINESAYIWMYDRRWKGIMCFRRDEFVDAGGYDERFEFYGPEDRDLQTRFFRRNGEPGIFPDGLIYNIPTPNDVKVKHYRIPGNKTQMSKRGRKVFTENLERGILVANPDGWGSWD